MKHPLLSAFKAPSTAVNETKRKKSGHIRGDRNVFQILLNQTEIRLYLRLHRLIQNSKRTCPFAVPNYSENDKYNLISVWFDNIWKTFLRVCRQAMKEFCGPSLWLATARKCVSLIGYCSQSSLWLATAGHTANYRFFQLKLQLFSNYL